ncbi:UDP-xylose and UDP-N-acetylglucosamine transporter [Thelohanellus kitauei]|uniref:UDP-xylose and UDP-N-acetylglucosamine transporter n=1 Tax=Thelohanellus kitauei TaxID=669202 RepID=A0A0C2MJG3_THEKT|nr:UDP-xylose and UDP-N-acetylglucosamine transporter [Thelohanellus kitauei]
MGGVQLVVLSVIGVFVFCCTNVHSLEALIRISPKCVNLITFSQFLFVSLYELIVTAKFFTVKPAVPIKNYTFLVILYFFVSSLNNYVLTLGIPMPLHMVFRSGSLAANMLMGKLIMGRKYFLRRYISVIMVSFGIFICTYFSSSQKAVVEKSGPSFATYTLGVGLMIISLFTSSILGILQERISNNHGKHPREMLFYTHFLSLPGFLVFSNFFRNFKGFGYLGTESAGYINFGGIMIPRFWFWLAVNVLTQYACVRCIYILTTECTSLTVTMVTTVRRFLSLLWSIYYFKNPFSIYHWIGSILIFSGSLIYLDPPRSEKQMN